MKAKKTCPKCNSKDIYRVPGGMVNGIWSLIYNNYVYRGLFFKPVKLTRYICSDCGYVEEWVDKKSDIRAIKDYYSKVLPIFKKEENNEDEEKDDKKKKND